MSGGYVCHLPLPFRRRRLYVGLHRGGGHHDLHRHWWSVLRCLHWWVVMSEDEIVAVVLASNNYCYHPTYAKLHGSLKAIDCAADRTAPGIV